MKEQPGIEDARKSTYYLFAGFAISWLPMPIAGLAALPLLASFIHSIRHLVALRRAGAPSAVRNSALIGVGLTTLLIGFVLAPLVQYARTMDYQECMWGANTKAAVASCEAKHHENPSGLVKFFLD